MNAAYLSLEIRLLIAQYGRRQVLQSLAEVENTTIAEIETKLKQIEEAKLKKKPAGKSPDELIVEVAKDRPSMRDLLQKLLALYDSRTFLPELRSAKAFLERHGASKNFKSRRDALPDIIRLLGSFEERRLRELLDETVASRGVSSFSLLANEIMASPRRASN